VDTNRRLAGRGDHGPLRKINSRGTGHALLPSTGDEYVSLSDSALSGTILTPGLMNMVDAQQQLVGNHCAARREHTFLGVHESGS
jgi:hypothetical protein